MPTTIVNRPAVRSARATIGLSETEAKSFSFCRLIDALASHDDPVLLEAAAFEIECIQATRANGMGKRGVPIPAEVLTTPLRTRGADIISVKEAPGYTGTGGDLVDNKVLWGSMIELLHNKSVMLGLASPLNGLQGNFGIPREESDPEAYWIGEGDTVPPSDANFGLLPLAPKTLSARVRLTRKMLIEPSLSVEAWVRNRIAKKVGLALDLAAIAGTGENNQPTGILNTVGVTVTDFAGVLPTYAELIAMESAVADANADIGQMRYIGTPTFRGHAKTTQKFANTAGTIWEPGNTVNGYGCEITKQMTANNVLFGNFADLLIGMWAGMEMLAERDVSTGSITVSIFQDADIKVLRTASFNRGYQATPPVEEE